MTKEYVKREFKAENVKVEIEGYSNMPFWNHDLTLEVVLGLLNTVDYKDFFESPNYNQLNDYTKQIIEAIEYSLGFDGLYKLVYGDVKKD
ncbi:hypothetical protein SAMN04487919_1707 [Bacillus sp. ok061]|uniref:hypothetical protein n=1 Tax=Bacillus sp. ok061 TaxID=1761766 RepID=UPI000772CC8B|nr:hypothetical protein [Bacillus sp. ok061]KXI45148.1 hypothetical protein ACS45_01385 [Bacillus cereus]SEG88992.1 hypothetical protein SAMN04487919_1707 [Bacillus sp. ok061]